MNKDEGLQDKGRDEPMNRFMRGRQPAVTRKWANRPDQAPNEEPKPEFLVAPLQRDFVEKRDKEDWAILQNIINTSRKRALTRDEVREMEMLLKKFPDALKPVSRGKQAEKAAEGIREHLEVAIPVKADVGLIVNPVQDEEEDSEEIEVEEIADARSAAMRAVDEVLAKAGKIKPEEIGRDSVKEE